MIQIVGGNIKVTNDVPEMLSAAGSVSLSSINFAIWSHLHPEVPDYTGYLALFSINTTLAVGPGFKSRLVTYPGKPAGPNTETLHEALAGRELIELDFKSASHLKVAGLRAIHRFDDSSFYLFEAFGHAPEHILALARTYADKFVLLAEDGAHHCGKFRPSPLVPLPDTISPSPFKHPTSVSSCSCSLFQPIHPNPESFHTTPFYEVAARHSEDPVAKRATLETLRVFDMAQTCSLFSRTTRAYLTCSSFSIRQTWRGGR